MHKSRLGCIIIDCETDDVAAATEFWSNAFGWKAQPADPSEPNYRMFETPADQPKVLVQAVTHPSRVHLDIETDDIDAEVGRLERLGARRVAFVKRWWVMEAPTGQRFCVVRPQRDDLATHGNDWRD